MNKRHLFLNAFAVLAFIAAFILFRQSQDTKAEIDAFRHPALEHPEVAGMQVIERIALLDPKPAFNFQLTDMDNSSTQLTDFSGKLVLVGFIYTTCPDVCGLLTQHFRYIQREFKEIIDEELVLVFITTDPETDTPDRVKAYTKGFQGRWHFLTGNAEQLQEVWKEYRVFVEPKKSVDIVYHSYMVALIDRNENIRYRYIGLVDPQEVIVRDINTLLKEGA